MARACLGTLLRLDDISDKYGVKKRFPLAQYAAEHWATHAQFEDLSSHIQEEMEILFDPDKPFFSAWIQIYDIDVRPDVDTSTLFYFSHGYSSKTDAAPLYYAALCGFYDIVERLIDKFSQEVNAIGGCYTSPLGAALTMEHFNVAQLLYQRGADIDVRGFEGRTPLYGASARGHLEIVQWLLGRGADPNLSDEFHGETALHQAAWRDYVKVVQILLQHNADPNIQNSGGEVPLHWASNGRNSNVTRLLLEHGVDVNARRKDGATPLHLASRAGCLEVARLLIEHGADRGAEDDKGVTPLQAAERSDMVELLSPYQTMVPNVGI